LTHPKNFREQYRRITQIETDIQQKQQAMSYQPAQFFLNMLTAFPALPAAFYAGFKLFIGPWRDFHWLKCAVFVRNSSWTLSGHGGWHSPAGRQNFGGRRSGWWALRGRYPASRSPPLWLFWLTSCRHCFMNVAERHC
jgi:hypothetical protein